MPARGFGAISFLNTDETIQAARLRGERTLAAGKQSGLPGLAGLARDVICLADVASAAQMFLKAYDSSVDPEDWAPSIISLRDRLSELPFGPRPDP